MPLEDALDAMFMARDLTPRSRQFYTERLSLFFGWMSVKAGVTDTDHLTGENLRAYFMHRREMGTSQSTLHADLRAVRAWLRFCVADDILDAKLASKLPQVKKTVKVIETFTDEQLNLLIRAAARTPQAARDMAIVLTFIDTGLRVQELSGLTLDRTFLKRDDAHLLVLGKGRREREVGLGRRSRVALTAYVTRHRPKGTPWTFVSARGGGQMTVMGVEKLLTRLEEAAGIMGVRCSPHTFRHSFAIRYLANGGDVYKLSRLLGHSTVSTTEMYLRAFEARQARMGPSVLDAMMEDRREE